MIRTPNWHTQSRWFTCGSCNEKFSTSLLLQHHEAICGSGSKADRLHASRSYALEREMPYHAGCGSVSWHCGVSTATNDRVTVKLENKLTASNRLPPGLSQVGARKHRPGSGWLEHEANVLAALAGKVGIPDVLWKDTKSSPTQAQIGLYPELGPSLRQLQRGCVDLYRPQSASRKAMVAEPLPPLLCWEFGRQMASLLQHCHRRGQVDF